jgi:acyl-CoA reductase-like NAD-dependent aldehyde dehydrogenase
MVRTTTPDRDYVTAWIDGEHVLREEHATLLPVIDPATRSVIAELVEDDRDMVDRAVMAARRAYASRTWSDVSVADRQGTLRRIADLIDREADELARLEVVQTGIPVSFVRSMHLPRAANNFRFFADYIGQRADHAFEQEAGYRTVTRREPIGVAALVAPWNMPLGLGLMKVAAAIAFGNSCVLKPSEATPLTLPAACALMKEAGLPDGVVNVVNGRGDVTGAALVSHPGIDALSFTGGTQTGRAIGVAAARNIRPVTMELGGKSANIVCDDADLDEAVSGSIAAAFSNNGQQCLAGSRLLLQASIADAFLERFLAATRALRIGDPLDPGTQLGPLQSQAHMDRVLAFAAAARADGCDILYGGGLTAGWAEGNYIDPIIVSAPSNAVSACQDEIFGPFVSVLTFDTVDDAIDIANDSPYGLVGYVWTQSIARAEAVASRLRAGVIWVNTPMARDLRAGFGGYGNSGIGREGGDACAQLFTQEKAVITKHVRSTPL